MFFSELASKKFMAGERVIIVPRPEGERHPEESMRRLHELLPWLKDLKESEKRKMMRELEWGR